MTFFSGKCPQSSHELDTRFLIWFCKKNTHHSMKQDRLVDLHQNLSLLLEATPHPSPMWGPQERACHNWSCRPCLPLRVCVWFGWLPALLMLVLGACLVLVGCSVYVCVCAHICMCVCGFRLCRRDSMQTRCVTRAPIFHRLMINFLFI